MKTNLKSLYNIYLKHPGIATDSRKVDPGCLFFALKGDHFNGNRFAMDALKKGAAYAIVDGEFPQDDDRLIVVNDVLKTLQQLASYHRDHLKIPVIGITGSNGKTTTKELIKIVLSKKYRTFATGGNLNNHIGVPLSVLSITEDHEMAVIEMGANHRGEIAGLSNISKPDFGIITNIGKAHLEGFGGYEGVIAAKTELYQFIRKNNGRLFVNGSDPLLMEKSEGIQRICYGDGPEAIVKGSITGKFPFLSVMLEMENKKNVVDTHLIGSYNLNNILCAACLGHYFGVAAEQICRALAAYQPKNNRSQWIETKKNKIVMDAYNANPSSMKVAIENFSEAPFDNKMLILGDMLELGNESMAEHRGILDLIVKNGYQDIVLVGPVFKDVAAADKRFSTYSDVNEAGISIQKAALSGKTILIKGSRGIQLEKLLELL